MLPWWAWAGIAWVLVTLLSLAQVDVGAKILGTFMLLELLCLVVVSVAILTAGGPEGIDFKSSFSPSAIFAIGGAGSAGIAFAFAFASFIGFEATAIYGEESHHPKTVVPKATYLAVGVITVLFALTSFAVVTGLGQSKAVEKVLALTTVDNVPLTDPAAVLFHLAKEYVGAWLSTTMGVLVLSSLFAGLLAFQNATSRYIFALSRVGALPRTLSHVNAQGAPGHAALLTSVVSGGVMLGFVLEGLDPILNMFFWFSGMAVVSIMLIEILVCVAVVVFFSKHSEGEGVFVTKIAPVLAFVGLSVGEYLLMSRFGLLTGAVAEGVDPTTTSWGLSPLGWGFAFLPFAILVLGHLYAHGRFRHGTLGNDELS
jgi:amino acid transporter